MTADDPGLLSKLDHRLLPWLEGSTPENQGLATAPSHEDPHAVRVSVFLDGPLEPEELPAFQALGLDGDGPTLVLTGAVGRSQVRAALAMRQVIGIEPTGTVLPR